MKHHSYSPGFDFVIPPEDFDRYTDRKFLQYCPGATMYMPGTKDYTKKLLDNSLPGLACMVLCFEDACPEEDVPAAEKNVLYLLETVGRALEEGAMTYAALPLIFCRVRNIEQFVSFAARITKRQAKALVGFNFPKFNSGNGREYYSILSALNNKLDEVLYGMPIIEDATVAFKETRIDELLKIKAILDDFRGDVLQVRVGATDFSSCFGVRRSIDYSIYDILPVRDCLSDIINVFGRNNDYVLSGPVWEYFRVNKQMMFESLPPYDLEDSILKRIPIFNDEVDGLLREVILDKANGFIGRTVIHPTHVKYVNALQAVVKEEYDDACQILDTTQGGVVKSAQANKMNEVKPHKSWAEKIYMRARAFGVVENEQSIMRLFSVQD